MSKYLHVHNIFSKIIFFLILLNRWASKISVGPIFLVDFTILASIVISPLKWLTGILKFYPVLFMLAISTLWLLHDILSTGGFDSLLMRRYALAVYCIIPVFFYVELRIIQFDKVILGNVVIISLLGLIVLYSGQVFRVSLLAEVLGIIFLHAIFTRNKSLEGVLITAFLGVFFLAAVFHTFLIGQGGIYKTPLIAFSLAAITIWTRNLFIILNFRSVNQRKLRLALIFLIFVFTLLFLSDFGRLILAEIVNGIKGLLGLDLNWPLIEQWSGDRSRASSYGTASTRVQFWLEILKFSIADPVRILIGNGHQFSFMEIVGGDFCNVFTECELIEPHNSFMGIYFRYGLLGVFIFLSLMYVTRKRFKNRVRKELLIGSAVFSIIYVSFEVVLESPHGALIFWFIWLSPYYIDMSGLTKTFIRSDNKYVDAGIS